MDHEVPAAVPAERPPASPVHQHRWADPAPNTRLLHPLLPADTLLHPHLHGQHKLLQPHLPHPGKSLQFLLPPGDKPLHPPHPFQDKPLSESPPHPEHKPDVPLYSPGRPRILVSAGED